MLACPSDSLQADTRSEEQNQVKARGGIKSKGIGVDFHQAETKAKTKTETEGNKNIIEYETGTKQTVNLQAETVNVKNYEA